MAQQNETKPNETELFWQAFRYVGEEMTPGEATDFEVQLASDQAAREAVARVVELSQMILATVPERSPAEDFVSPASTSRAWMQPVGWVAVGAAACLAVMMAYQSFGPASGTAQTGAGPSEAVQMGSAQIAKVAPASSDNLALAWASARPDLPGPEEATATVEGTLAEGTLPTKAAGEPGTDQSNSVQPDADQHNTGDTVAAGDELPDTGPMEEFTEPVAPGWLLVAVEDARNDASQEN